MEIIENDKRKKGLPCIKVSFAKDGLTHYPYGTGQIDNYKFITTLEYQEYTKSDKRTLVEWKCIHTNKVFYSRMGLLNDVCLGLAGDIQESKRLQIKGKFTFTKSNNAVLLTISKN
jgi:hypothetical protein